MSHRHNRSFPLTNAHISWWQKYTFTSSLQSTKINYFQSGMHSVLAAFDTTQKQVDRHGNRWQKCHGSAVMRTRDASCPLTRIQIHGSKYLTKKEVARKKATAAAHRDLAHNGNILRSHSQHAIRQHRCGIGKFNRVKRYATTIAFKYSAVGRLMFLYAMRRLFSFFYDKRDALLYFFRLIMLSLLLPSPVPFYACLHKLYKLSVRIRYFLCSAWLIMHKKMYFFVLAMWICEL